MPRSFDHVDWHIQVRAENEKAVDKVIEMFRQKAGTRARVISCEGSWRVENLYDVKLTTPMNVSDPAQAIFRLLLMLKEVATGWQVKGPIAYEDDQWLFGAVAALPLARFQVLGFEWVNVELRNFAIIQRDAPKRR